MADYFAPTKTKNSSRNRASGTILKMLREEKAGAETCGIYAKTMVDFTYHSNALEGNRLTLDEVRGIYETNTIQSYDGSEKAFRVDDIRETVNHFCCIDLILKNADRPLSETFLKKLHGTLKGGTTDSDREWFAVGDYKRLPNEVGGLETVPPKEVHDAVKTLLSDYNKTKEKTLHDILDFHVKFERIHPFQDGNGRVGRLIMFKECLKYNIVPFIMEEDLAMFYYRGLAEWEREKGYLTDTCLTAQDRYKLYLDYFRIKYL